jgi:excisionase family DNA binding protein
MEIKTRPADPLLTDQQAAKLLGIKPSTLQIWRTQRRYSLPYVKVGRCVRYRRSAVEAFIEQRTVEAA